MVLEDGYRRQSPETYSNAPESDAGIKRLLEKMDKSINDTIKKAKNKALLSVEAKKKSVEAT